MSRMDGDHVIKGHVVVTLGEHGAAVLSPGAPKGNANALKHGHYSAAAIARRREFAALIRSAKVLLTAAGS